MALFKVATFNVNSVKSRIPILQRWLFKNPVDVLCLQETKVQDPDFPVGAFEEMGYHVVFSGQKAYNGVAIASLEPPEDVVFGFGDGLEPDDRSRLARVRFGNLHIINSYVPQGKSIDHPDYAYKMRFFERILNLLERNYKDSDLLLWTGDLNVAPTEIDVTHPENKRDHVCFHIDVRKALEEVMSWGLVDVFRKHHPDAVDFTFFDYRVKGALERNIGWRIDHLLATKPLADRSIDAYIDKEPRAWERPSDHTVLVGIFDL